MSPWDTRAEAAQDPGMGKELLYGGPFGSVLHGDGGTGHYKKQQYNRRSVWWGDHRTRDAIGSTNACYLGGILHGVVVEKGQHREDDSTRQLHDGGETFEGCRYQTHSSHFHRDGQCLNLYPPCSALS